MNVVAMWRRRHVSLGRKAWQCLECNSYSLVKRLRCTYCGGPFGAELVALPRSGTVCSVTRAGVIVERLDHVTSRCVAVMLDMGNSQRLVCLLSDADAKAAESLRGEAAYLAIRRIGYQRAGSDGPILYGFKAVANLGTRKKIRKNNPSQDKEKK